MIILFVIIVAYVDTEIRYRHANLLQATIMRLLNKWLFTMKVMKNTKLGFSNKKVMALQSHNLFTTSDLVKNIVKKNGLAQPLIT